MKSFKSPFWELPDASSFCEICQSTTLEIVWNQSFMSLDFQKYFVTEKQSKNAVFFLPPHIQNVIWAFCIFRSLTDWFVYLLGSCSVSGIHTVIGVPVSKAYVVSASWNLHCSLWGSVWWAKGEKKKIKHPELLVPVPIDRPGSFCKYLVVLHNSPWTGW